MPQKVSRTEVVPSPAAATLVALDKENREMRRRVAANLKHIRTLQNDIAAVHANMHAQMDDVSHEFSEKFRDVQEKNSELTERNDIVGAQLLHETQRVEEESARVEAARSRREAVESEVAARQADAEQRKETLSQLDAEATEIRDNEGELAAEIKRLEKEKRSGVLNLEQARIRNADEAKELAAEEATLVRGREHIDAIRSKIAALRQARARASH